MNDLISVIVPVYNAEKYLAECIASIQLQTFQSFEIILVDDGSTDASYRIAESFKAGDVRIKLIHTENRGVSAARNTGIANAGGKYIMFVDADDLLADDALEILYNDIHCTGADIAIGRVSTNRNDTAVHDNGSVCWTNKDALLAFISDDELLYGSVAKLYSARVASGAVFPVSRKIHEDGYFVLQCLLKSQLICVHDIELYYYRPNMESASHAYFSEKFFDILYFGKIEREMIDKECPELADKSINIEIKANLSMLRALCNTKRFEYGKCIHECISFVIKHRKEYIDGKNHDQKWMWIVSHHLYWPYKWAYGIVYRDRIR